MEIMIASIYAAIVALSYRRAGLFPALFWPVTVVIAGIMVYMTVVFGPTDQDSE